MNPLSEATLETLQMIAAEPRRTGRITLFDHVCGTSAAGLIRRGYARYLYDQPDVTLETMWNFDRRVEITEAGRKRLALEVTSSSK